MNIFSIREQNALKFRKISKQRKVFGLILAVNLKILLSIKRTNQLEIKQLQASEFLKKAARRKYYQFWRKKEKRYVIERLEAERKHIIIADKFASKYIPKKCIRRWKEYVNHQKDQRWKEFRKEILRGSVKVLHYFSYQDSQF